MGRKSASSGAPRMMVIGGLGSFLYGSSLPVEPGHAVHARRSASTGSTANYGRAEKAVVTSQIIRRKTLHAIWRPAIVGDLSSAILRAACRRSTSPRPPPRLCCRSPSFSTPGPRRRLVRRVALRRLIPKRPKDPRSRQGAAGASLVLALQGAAPARFSIPMAISNGSWPDMSV